MKNLQSGLLLAYFKRKSGVALTYDEDHALEQYRIDNPLEDAFDPEAFEQLARYRQEMLPAEQFFKKYTVPLAIPFPTQKQVPTARVRRLTWWRHPAVAASLVASLIIVVGAAWWYFSRNQASDTPAVTATDIITPAAPRATLQLADNRSIALNTTAQQTLPAQGNARLSVEQPGILEYQELSGASQQQAAGTNRLQTPRGGQFRLVLSDGTKVWLSPATVLRYPATFGKGERVVELEEGEAYFEVAKRSSQQPFIVRYKRQQIQVLGTQFNVKAYQEEGLVTTALVEGSVKITQDAQSLVLSPGQQAILNKQDKLSVSVVDLSEATARRNQVFTFRNKRMSEIMTEVQRWYDVEIVYVDPLSDEYFNVEGFPRRESLQRLLNNLEATRAVHFEVKGRKVFIRK